MASLIDAAVAEAVAWASVQDAACGAALLADLCSAEAAARAALVSEAATALLTSAFAMATATSSAAGRAARDADRAAAEAAAWGDVAQAGASQPEPAGLAASEARVAALSAEQRVDRDAEEAAVAALRAERDALTAEMRHLRETAAQATDAADRDRRAIRDEAAALEAQVARRQEELRHVGVDIADAKQRLADAEAEATAAQAAVRVKESVPPAAPLATPPPVSPNREADREVDPAAPVEDTAPPSGLDTLQSVRAQLREIRGTTAAEGEHTGAYSEGPATPVRGFSQTGSSLRGPSRRTSLDVMGGGGGAVAMSPWKARLQKLQTDLKTLRTELGSPEEPRVQAAA